jgi:hypothetical protein
VDSWEEISCPVGGCDYRARMRVGASGSGASHADRVSILDDEHPSHPGDHTALVVGERLARP